MALRLVVQILDGAKDLGKKDSRQPPSLIGVARRGGPQRRALNRKAFKLKTPQWAPVGPMPARRPQSSLMSPERFKPSITRCSHSSLD